MLFCNKVTLKIKAVNFKKIEHRKSCRQVGKTCSLQPSPMSKKHINFLKDKIAWMSGNQRLDIMFFLFICNSGSEAKLHDNCIHTPCLMYYIDDQRDFPKSQDAQDPYSIKSIHQHGCHDGEDQWIDYEISAVEFLSCSASHFFLLEYNHCWYFQATHFKPASQSILPININPHCSLRRQTKKKTQIISI